MSTQGRRGGSRRKRSDGANAAAPTAVIDTAALASTAAIAPAAADTAGADAELLDDQTVAIAGGRRGFGLGRSIPGAIVGSLLVVGLAFGAAGPGGILGSKDGNTKDGATAAQGDATALGDTAGNGGEYGDDKDGGYDGDTDGSKDVDYDDPDGDGGGDTDETAKPDAGEGDDPAKEPEPDQTKEPRPEETKKPAEDSDPKPDPDEEPSGPIAVELGIEDGHPVISWASCEGLDFDYYKVVRSTDSTVSWPAGSGDELVAAVERGGYRKAWDKSAAHGDKVWYRVFCVRKTEAGYKVVNASATKGIEVPEEAPPPDPISLGLEADVDDEGKVVLTWSVCEVDGFAFYKVVRSDWNDNPSYLPWTEGSEVIGVVSGMYDTEWHDGAPESGETAWYRVQCIGYEGDQKVLLGESAVTAVTMP